MAEPRRRTVTVNGRTMELAHIKLNQYYRTLLGEMFRVGIIGRPRLKEREDEVRLLLHRSMDRWAACHPGGVDFETRDKLERTLYRNLDAYLFSLGSVSAAVYTLLDQSVAEMEEAGDRFLRRVRFEITGLTVSLRHKMLPVGNGPYERVCPQIMHALRDTVRNPDARRLSDKLDYPPALMTYTLNGLFYLQRYVCHLTWESDFCRQYDPMEIAGLFELYCRRRDLDMRTCKVNIYLLVFKNALFCEYLGKEQGSLAVYEDECNIAEELLGCLPEDEQEQILLRTADRLLGGSRQYRHRTAECCMKRFLNAIRYRHLRETLTVIDL